MKLVLMALLVLSFSSAHAGVKIESCENIAGRIAAQMAIGNLRMNLSDVKLKTEKAVMDNSDNAYRVTVRAKEERASIVDSNYIVIAKDANLYGLCQILSVTKVSR